jgi:hypothetical protein
MTASIRIAHTVQGITAPFTDDNSYSAGMGTTLEETITGGGNQTFANFDVDVSECEALVMLCDRDITITVNDDGTPDATINLKADKVLTWTSDGYFSNPLGSVDVTSIKATLAAGADATLRIDVVQDPSP